MFITIEGIDCTGKSTISRLLAEQMQAVLYQTPPRDLKVKREEIDANASPEEHYLFYLKGIYIASKEIESLLNDGKSVICDRYWLSTYVYHRVMGVEVDIKDFCDIIQPDLTILLLVSSNIQAKRFLERGMSAGDRRMINRQLELSQRYVEEIVNIEPYLIINTDYIAPEEIIDKILSYIK